MSKSIPRILFLNLTAFSKTGGLEKFNKSFLKALSELEGINEKVQSYSLYDNDVNEKYFPSAKYRGFSGKHVLFVLKSIFKSKDFDLVILGHINLAVIGCVVKRLFPKIKIILITHGVEVWQPLQMFKKEIIKKADLILAVSNFTKNKLQEVHQVEGNKIKLFHNTIDPYFPLPSDFNKSEKLRKRYNLKMDDFVLFTLTRLSYVEKYKGYDTVIRCLPQLSKIIPNIKYLIAGKYDEAEKDRVDEIIKELHLEERVIFAGYIQDSEIKEHYQLGDLFIMPSQGEGFGIVFIEAIVCGTPVIAGNQDGSVDALQNGTLGTLVNPFDIEEISESVVAHYNNRMKFDAEAKYKMQQHTLSYFSFSLFKERLKHLLN